MIKLATRTLVVGLGLVGSVGQANAQPAPLPDEPPTTPMAAPDPVLVPAPPDPLAATMTQQAHSAALRADCDAVERFAYRVRSLDPDLYREKFATDPVIIACDPRPARAANVDAPRDLYHATGFTMALALALGRTLETANLNLSSGPPQFALRPTTSAMIGYQNDLMAIGAQVRFGRATRTQTVNGMAAISTSETSVLVGPALRAQVWRNRSARAELLLAFDLGIGETWTDLSDPAGLVVDTTPTDLHVVARGGFALRYWLAPSFALGATTSLGVDYLELNQSGNGADGSSVHVVTSTSTSIDTALDVVGVF